MDRAVIEAKLESLRRCLTRLREKTPPSAQALARDVDLQDIVALNLIRAVQVCADITAHLIAAEGLPAPTTMGHGFRLLAEHGLITPETAERMSAAVGFRNIAVHNYERLDWEVVHAILQKHLADFDAFARSVDQRLQ